MSRAATIIKNTAANYVQQFATVAVFMVLTPYAARQLGTEQFGLWSLMWAMAGVLALADMGVSSAVVKFIADARGHSEPERIRHLAATFFWVQNVLALAVLLITAALLPFLAVIFEIPQAYQRIGAIVFAILGLRVASSMPFGLFAGLLVAYRKQGYASLVKAAGTIVYGVGTMLVLRQFPTAVTLAICNISVHIAANILIIVLACRAVPEFSIAPRFFKRALVREISSFSGSAFMVQVSALLYTKVDTFIVQRFLSLASVAHYAVAMQTINRGALFCRQMSSALTPLVAEMKGANDPQAIRLVVRKGTKLNTALTTPLLGGLIWLAGDLIDSWMGPEFSTSVLPLRLLAAAAWIDAVSGISANVLTMTGHQKLMARVIIACQLVNIGLTLLLVRHYGIGGVALASLVASTLAAVATLALAAHLLDAALWRTYGSILASVVPAILMLLAISALRWAFTQIGTGRITLPVVAMLEMVGCIVFFAAFYAIGCSKRERAYYREKAIETLRRRGRK